MAVIFNDGIKQSLTYPQFNITVKRLSTMLRHEKNFSKNGVIAVYSDSSLNLPVIVYSIFSLKAVFLPLSTNKPMSDIIESIKKCKVEYMFVQKTSLPSFLLAIKDKIPLLTEISFNFIKDYILLKLKIERLASSQDYFYIVQSSGSTGRPKIIYAPWKCVKPNVIDMRNAFTATCKDVIFISSALTFDASIVLMLLAWSSGATMLLVSRNVMCNPDSLSMTLQQNQVSIIQCTTSLLHLIGMERLKKYLVNRENNLRVLACGGERFLKREDAIALMDARNKLSVYNIYGTSEVSAWATLYRITDASFNFKHDKIDTADWVPLGDALTNTKIEVRNKENKSIKYGEGRIFIGGHKRVCKVDDEECTDEDYMRDTGDLGIILNGNIYYCGRADSNVKRNGQLICLDLLQRRVENITGVKYCCCVIKLLTSKKENLVMFVAAPTVAAEHIPSIEDDILKMINQDLSSSHIPDRIVFRQHFPVNNHGKIDKDGLMSSPDAHAHLSHQKSISDCLKFNWKLSLSNKSTKEPENSDNFILCGGDSFAAVFLINKLSSLISTNNVSFERLLNEVLTRTYGDVEMLLRRLANITVNEKQEEERLVQQCTFSKTKQACNHYVALCRQNKKVTCSCEDKHFANKIRFSNISKISELWKYDMKKCIDASPLVVFSNDYETGIVYIGSHAHVFSAVFLDDGRTLWETVLGDRIESSSIISLDGKYICVGCYDGCVYILERYTGAIYWKYATGDVVKSSPCVDRRYGILVVGSHDQHVHALNISTKECLWKVFFSSSCFSSPMVRKSHVYVALLSGCVHALEITTGECIWKVNLQKPVFSSFCLCESFTVVGCVDGALYAIDFDGVVKWKFQTAAAIFSSPVCVDTEERILCGSNDKCVYCLTNYGDLLWKYETSAAVYASVAFVQQSEQVAAGSKRKRSKTDRNCFVVVSTNGDVFVLDCEGICAAKYSLPGEVYSSPVVINNRIMVGCRNDSLYCLQVETR